MTSLGTLQTGPAGVVSPQYSCLSISLNYEAAADQLVGCLET
jgi:hypothetical protein